MGTGFDTGRHVWYRPGRVIGRVPFTHLTMVPFTVAAGSAAAAWWYWRTSEEAPALA
jgi:hypothetical protein